MTPRSRTAPARFARRRHRPARSALRRAVGILPVLCAAALLAGGTAAQADGRPGEVPDSRVEALRDEVVREEAALQALRSASAEELDSLRTQRRRLADELLQLALREAAGAPANATAGEEAARLERELGRRLEELGTVLGAAQSALERVVFAARGVPGLDGVAESARTRALAVAEARTALPTAAALLDEDVGGGATGELPGATEVRAALATFARDLAGADTIATVDARIRTADGREEDVRLLRAGWIGFAYRASDGRVGLALASPVDADGYRWSESLDPETAALVDAAITDAATGAPVTLPVDPTGQVRPDALAADTSLVEQLAGGGPLMVPLALVALAAVVLGLERVLTLFVRNRRAHALAHRVLRAAEEARLDEATRLCDHSAGIVPRTLGACLARARQGKAAMEDAIQSQLLQELPGVSRFLRTLALLAAIAPLVGLLGTVTGIIQTFGVIKALGTTDPTLMAGGISVALVTTAAGLSVAIPTLLVQGLLRGRGDRLIADAERYAAALLTILAHGEAQEAGAAG